MRTLWLTALSIFAIACALAADISGTWKAQAPNRGGGGAREVTFTFKVDADKLTGSIADGRGSTEIKDGKVSGDSVTFSAETPRGKRTYTGTVSGNEIKFKREGGQAAQEFVAKRVS